MGTLPRALDGVPTIFALWMPCENAAKCVGTIFKEEHNVKGHTGLTGYGFTGYGVHRLERQYSLLKHYVKHIRPQGEQNMHHQRQDGVLLLFPRT